MKLIIQQCMYRTWRGTLLQQKKQSVPVYGYLVRTAFGHCNLFWKTFGIHSIYYTAYVYRKVDPQRSWQSAAVAVTDCIGLTFRLILEKRYGQIQKTSLSLDELFIPLLKFINCNGMNDGFGPIDGEKILSPIIKYGIFFLVR